MWRKDTLSHITHKNMSPNINGLNVKVQNIKIKNNVGNNLYYFKWGRISQSIPTLNTQVITE